jgi:predicted secreted protein
MAEEKTKPTNVNNNMVKAILTTLFCCLPFGVVSIIKAAEVNGKVAAGDIDGAVNSAAEANKWANIAIIVGLVVIVGYIMLTFLGIGMALSDF